MSEDNDECLFHFALTNDAGFPFVLTFDDTEPGSKPNERIFFMGRGPFLKIDNKVVSRKHAKLLLNFKKGVCKLTSVNINFSKFISITLIYFIFVEKKNKTKNTFEFLKNYFSHIV